MAHLGYMFSAHSGFVQHLPDTMAEAADCPAVTLYNICTAMYISCGSTPKVEIHAAFGIKRMHARPRIAVFHANATRLTERAVAGKDTQGHIRNDGAIQTLAFR